MDEQTNNETDHEEVDYKAAAFNAINENERLRQELRGLRAAVKFEDIISGFVDFVEKHYIFCIVITYMVVSLIGLAMEGSGNARISKL